MSLLGRFAAAGIWNFSKPMKNGGQKAIVSPRKIMCRHLVAEKVSLVAFFISIVAIQKQIITKPSTSPSKLMNQSGVQSVPRPGGSVPGRTLRRGDRAPREERRPAAVPRGDAAAAAERLARGGRAPQRPLAAAETLHGFGVDLSAVAAAEGKVVGLRCPSA